MWKTAAITAYSPLDIGGNRTVKQEGKPVDEMGKPLHYFEDYKKEDPTSFVGLAADVDYFTYGTKIKIKEYPDIRFKVMDNGGGFKGKKGSAFDIAVRDHKLGNSISGSKNEPRLISWDYVDHDERKYIPAASAGFDLSSMAIAALLVMALLKGKSKWLT